MDIIVTMVPLFGLIVSGYLLRKAGAVDDKIVRVINGYIFYIGLSAVMFLSFYDIGVTRLLDPRLYLLNLLPILLIILVAYGLAKLVKMEAGLLPIFVICAFNGNTTYIGFPVAVSMRGFEALKIAALISALYSLFTYSAGIAVLEKYSGGSTSIRGSITQIARIPMLWAAALGLLLFSVPIPDLLRESLRMLSMSVSPLALIATGCMIRLASTRADLTNIGLLSAIKLIVMPVIVITVAFLLGYSGRLYEVSLIQAATPVAVINIILADRYRMNREFVTNSVVISTVLFAFTLFLLGLFLGPQ